MGVHPVLSKVTDRIRRRSEAPRSRYLAELEQMRGKGPVRHGLSCTNLAHGFAGATSADKIVLRRIDCVNIAIVSSYNDMLSAHQPFERFPPIIKAAAREAGATAQFAGASRRCATGSRKASRGWSCRCSAATSSRSPPPSRCRTTCSTRRCASGSATRSSRAS
jgi:phosphogluconate dehydratase